MIYQTFLISFLSGLFGAMGLGSGTVLIIWLTGYAGFSQLEAQGMNLVFFIPCAAISLFLLYKKEPINIKSAIPVAFGGICGIFICQFFIKGIPTELLRKLFGAFVITVGIIRILKLIKAHKKENFKGDTLRKD